MSALGAAGCVMGCNLPRGRDAAPMLPALMAE